MPEGKVFNLTSKTTLPDLAKIISESELLIANDTGAVHVAASVRKHLFVSLMENDSEDFIPIRQKYLIKLIIFIRLRL